MRNETSVMLRNDFFKNEKIKKLESMKNGDTYIWAYIQMQFEASKLGGVLLFEETMNNFAEEIAVSLDENGERITAQQAIDALLSADLVELSEDGKMLRFKELEVLSYGTEENV